MKGFSIRTRISHKIFAVISIGLIFLALYSVGIIFILKSQTSTLEIIYKQKVEPLDDLRGMQMMFWELEYRMAAVMSDIISPIGAGNHMKTTLTDIDKKWEKVTHALLDFHEEEWSGEEVEKFEKGYSQLKAGLFQQLLHVYYDDNAEGVSAIYDKYLDYKPLIFKSIDRMVQNQKASVKDYYFKNRKLAAQINNFVIILSISLVLCNLVMGYLLASRLAQPIIKVKHFLEKVAGGDLSSRIQIDSCDEVGHLAHSTNKMVKSLRDIIGKTISNVTEITKSCAFVAGQSGDAAVSAHQASELAISGGEHVNETFEGMNKVVELVTRSTRNIEALSESSGEIGQIIQTINDVVSQTNILALSVERRADMAGEQGAYLAIVANEIRNLSDRMSSSSGDIKKKIHVIQSEIIAVVEIMQQENIEVDAELKLVTRASQSLKQIVESVKNVTIAIEQIATATEEQSIATKELSTRIDKSFSLSPAGPHNAGPDQVQEDDSQAPDRDVHS
jgi:methyl-accepting chemotaxis protein